MDRILEEFISVLRTSDVRVSVSESIDAMHAARLIGYGDREVLKDSLSSVLAKSTAEKEIFNECFDSFFSFDGFSDKEAGTPQISDMEIQQEPFTLTRMLASGDSAGLTVSMIDGARAAGVNEIRYSTQKNMYIWKILNHMGMDGLDRNIEQLLQGNTSSSEQKALELQEAKNYLIENVRDFVERQFDLYGRARTEEMLERHLNNVNLSNLEEKHYHRMYTIIKKIVRRLNDIHSRRRKTFRRGQLDFKKTLRKNIANQGIPFDVKWKKRKIDRPDIVVICDVSRSVRTVVRFFLLFLYSLNEAIIKIRTFIFCTNLIEVSSIFDEYPVEEAVARLQTGTDLDIRLGITEYGWSLRDFKKNWLDTVTNKTTVIILGDGRSNYGDPETEIIKLIQKRSKRLIWLNPEGRSLWGTGDSEMKRYAPLCDLARECNTLNQLERVVDDLL